MDFRTTLAGLGIGLILLGMGALGACTDSDYRQAHATSTTTSLTAAADSTAFGVDVTLCRKIGRKTGRRIGAGTTFRMSEKSRVQAVVDFTNVTAGKDYTVHLVWIRPDGREMYRRFAEVRQEAVAAETFRTVVRWLDAEDLHKVRADTLAGAAPQFTLDSRLNTSLSSSGPLSQRIASGVPRQLFTCSRTRTKRSPGNDVSTSIARASRTPSSNTFNVRKHRPL